MQKGDRHLLQTRGFLPCPECSCQSILNYCGTHLDAMIKLFVQKKLNLKIQNPLVSVYLSKKKKKREKVEDEFSSRAHTS